MGGEADNSTRAEISAPPLVAQRWTRRFAVASLVVAVAGLVGYLPGLATLGSIHEDFIPMAPSTAACFVLLAAIIGLEPKRDWRRLWLLVPIVVFAFCALEVVGFWISRDLNFEDALVPTAGLFNGVPVARMSPLTGAVFCPIAAATMLIMLAGSDSRRRTAAAYLATTTAIAAVTVLLGYMLGTPLLYDTGTVPMAATTALGFLFVSCAGFFASGVAATPVGLLLGRTTRAKLLRSFLPLTVLAAIVAPVWLRVVEQRLQINNALMVGALLLVVVLATSLVVTRVARSVGNAIDRLEAERIVADEQRAQLERELFQARKLESIGRLAGGVAHDFNNILTSVLGYAELVLDSLPAGHEASQDVQEIVNGARRAARLTQQLLAFGRRQVATPVVLSINNALQQEERMLRRLAGEHLELVLRLADDLWLTKLDPAQLDQIILNLVGNACDATAYGGTIRIATSNRKLSEREGASLKLPPGEYVSVSVEDEGEGMDADTLEHIFEPFYSTKGGGGTGLGLATVHGIVAQNGGGVLVRSEPGAGALFEVLLLRADGPATLAAEPRAVVAAPTRRKVLLVDDEQMVRRVTRRLLEREGYDVVEAAGGEAALALLRDDGASYDLLLTDVVMPGMSGRELSDEAKHLQPDLAVVFMSGHTDSIIAPQGVLEPGVAFLHKPFTRAALLRKLEQMGQHERGRDRLRLSV